MSLFRAERVGRRYRLVVSAKEELRERIEALSEEHAGGEALRLLDLGRTSWLWCFELPLLTMSRLPRRDESALAEARADAGAGPWASGAGCSSSTSKTK